MNTKVHFSSANDEWETPKDLFDLLDTEFQFTLDVCASKENAKCRSFYSKQDDALSNPWTGRCWMNPPYGRQIGAWVMKAALEAEKRKSIVVCLLPSRTDTRWWHFLVSGASEIRFLRGRLTFVGAKHPAPFPSAIVVFGTPRRQNPVSYWNWRRTKIVSPNPRRSR